MQVLLNPQHHVLEHGEATLTHPRCRSLQVLKLLDYVDELLLLPERHLYKNLLRRLPLTLEDELLLDIESAHQVHLLDQVEQTTLHDVQALQVI